MDYSVTIVAKTTLSLSKNAGTGRLAYEIQGADKSSIVEATTNVDWIKNFNYAEPGYVQFDYTALDEGVESRSGQITLSSTGAADVVVTVNQGGTMTFERTIDPKSITANGCAMQIVPSNESETYLCAFMTKEYVDSFESDEAFIQADLEAVIEQAGFRVHDVSETQQRHYDDSRHQHWDCDAPELLPRGRAINVGRLVDLLVKASQRG